MFFIATKLVTFFYFSKKSVKSMSISEMCKFVSKLSRPHKVKGRKYILTKCISNWYNNRCKDKPPCNNPAPHIVKGTKKYYL